MQFKIVRDGMGEATWAERFFVAVLHGEVGQLPSTNTTKEDETGEERRLWTTGQQQMKTTSNERKSRVNSDNRISS